MVSDDAVEGGRVESQFVVTVIKCSQVSFGTKSVC